MILYAFIVPLGIFFGECAHRYIVRSGVTHCERSESWGLGSVVMFILAQTTTIAVALATEQPPFSSLP